MKIKAVLEKVLSVALPARRNHKNEIMEKCGCPCHDGQPWISHFMPCCKYTGQQIKK